MRQQRRERKRQRSSEPPEAREDSVAPVVEPSRAQPPPLRAARCWHVVLRFRRSAAPYIRERIWHHSQVMDTGRDGGRAAKKENEKSLQ